MSDHIERLEWAASTTEKAVVVRPEDLRSLLSDVERMKQALTRAGARLDILAMYVPTDKSAVVAVWADEARQALSAPEEGPVACQHPSDGGCPACCVETERDPLPLNTGGTHD